MSQRKMVRTGSLRFDVEDLEVARSAVQQQLAAQQGHVESEDRSDVGGSLTLRVRLPSDRMDAFIEALRPLGRLQDQHINAEDVTAVWVDVEARLAAKRQLEARYLQLIPQAKNVAEVLEVENALATVRADIESMDAQMKVMRDQVALSTLTITCIGPDTYSGYSPSFRSALRDGWDGFVIFLEGMVRTWPFLLLIVASIFLFRRWRRQRK